MSKEIKVGVVGVGAIAERSQIPAFSSIEGVQIVALSDIDQTKAQRVAKIYSIPHIFSDYNKMFELEELDAVSICTPNFLHAPVAIAAAKAGKHILCEKPMATTLEEADEMIKTARESKVILMIEQSFRFIPKNEVVKEIIDKGLIGKIFHIRTRFASPGPEFWSPTGKWFFSKQKAGGGALIDDGIHSVDLMRWFVGEVKEVIGISDTLVKDIEVDDNAVAALKFQNGAIGVLEVSWTTSSNIYCTEITGTKGRILIDYPNTPLKISINDGFKGEFEPEVPKESKRGGVFRHFVDCVRKNQEPLTSGEEGRKSLEVLLAIYKSSQEGRKISLPLSY